MSKGTVNKVIILGRLGFDPEVRYMPSGSAVATLRVATTDGYKDKQSGEFIESTEWHRVVLFGRLAEIAGEYLKKGRMVYVEGRIRTQKWTDQSGVEKYSTEIVANEMQLVGGNNTSGATNSASSNTSHLSGEGATSSNSGSGRSNNINPEHIAAVAPPVPAMEYDKFSDDDIPF